MKMLVHTVAGSASEPKTLLTYSIATTPSPLQASPEDVKAPLTSASITVVADNLNAEPADIKSVIISFDIAPRGSAADDATYLTSNPDGMMIQILNDPKKKWAPEAKAGVFTATANDGSEKVVGEGLGFIISGIRPNRSVGTFVLTVTEIRADGSRASQAFHLAKFPHAFVLDNFRADMPSVDNGNGTTLRWHASSGAKLSILSAAGAVDVTDKSFWATGPLSQTTTYLLQASYGDLALVTLALTVQVLHPEEELTRLTVREQTVLKGEVTAEQGLRAKGDVTLEGTLTVPTFSAEKVDMVMMRIGQWQVVATTGKNSLVFLNAETGEKIEFLPDGTISSQERQVITDGSPVYIEGELGWLSYTKKYIMPSPFAELYSSFPNTVQGWNGSAYWLKGDKTTAGSVNLRLGKK